MRRAEEAFVGTTRFDVYERLGDGGGGVVYRARDRLLGCDVALKVMRDAHGDGALGFRRSFGSLKRLSHPNLVQLLDLVEDGGRLLLVMELVEGEELLAYVRHGPQGADEIRLRAAFLQLAQGLYALHAERKVHRDVKPGNVRVTREGRVVLLDLDLSYDLDSESGLSVWPSDTRMVGTALYMAPEQASSARASFASDWYSFGVVLYEALTATLPYRGSDVEILLKKQESAPVPADQIVPDVPRDLSALAADLLACSPAQRPVGAEVLRRLGVEEETVSQRLSLTSIVSARPLFVGREHELDRLLGALGKAQRRAYVVRVTGEPGVGKTTLCEELLRRVSHLPGPPCVLVGSCTRYPTRPHAAFVEPVAKLVDTLRETAGIERLKLGRGALSLLERMLGRSVLAIDETRSVGVTPPDPLEQRLRALEALRALFAEVSSVRPIVLWLDNYQWADLDTQRIVRALTRGEGRRGLLVVLSEDLEHGQASSLLPSADELIALTGLTSQAASALAEHLTERANGPPAPHVPGFRDALPLLIQERVRYALYFASAPPEGISLQALLLARIQSLSSDTRWVLELACAAFDPVSQDVLERASGMSRAVFSRHLSTLRVGSFVRCFVQEGEDYVSPSHLVVATTVLEQTDKAGPRAFEKLSAALQAREGTRASPRLVRVQLESADVDAAAESALLAASEATRALSFQRAAELFSLAISHIPAAEDEAFYTLLRSYAETLSNAGWSLAAAHTFRKAAQLAKTADAIHMRQRAVDHLLRAAEHDMALDAVRELLASFGSKIPSTPRSAFWILVSRRIYLALRGLGYREVSEGQVSESELRHVDALWSVGTRLSMVDIMRGGDLLARGLIAALRIGEPMRVARALCTESWTVLGYDRAYTERMSQTLETARNLVEREASPFIDGHYKLAEGMASFARFAVTEGITRVRDAERVFRDGCNHATWEVSVAQAYQLIGLALSARFAETAARYEVWTEEAQERGDVWGAAQLVTIGAVGVKLARDLPNEAAEDVRSAALRWQDAKILHVQHLFGMVTAGYIDLYRAVPRGLEVLEQRWGLFKRQFFLQVRLSRGLLYELRGRARLLSAHLTRDARLLRGAESDARTLLQQDEPPERGFGKLILANVCVQRGHKERALELLRAAIEDLEPQGLELWSLSARCVLGRLMGGELGREVYREAYATLGARGAKNPTRIIEMMLPGCTRSL